MEIISNLWQVYGPNMSTILWYLLGGLLIGSGFLSKPTQAKLFELASKLWPGNWGVSTARTKSPSVAVSVGATIEHALILVQDLALDERIEDGKLVLDLIGRVQKSGPEPVVKPAADPFAIAEPSA